jgi:hypothetical protein
MIDKNIDVMYTYLLLRYYQKMEAFGLFEDGYVLNIECCSLGGHYSAVKSNVRPRTNGIYSKQ